MTRPAGLVPRIHVTTTFLRDPDNQYRPATSMAEPTTQRCARPSDHRGVEQAPAALLLGSGMSAATAVFLALKPGDHVVAPSVMYWGLRNWLITDAIEWGLRVDIVDTSDLAALRAAVRPGETKLVWLETPANPLWTITDIRAAAEIAHAAGARCRKCFANN